MITEGLYTEQITPIETKRNLFNVSLYPGSGLPTFNFGFISSHRSNGLDRLNIIFNTVEGITSTTIITDTLDNRIDLLSNQFNISMTNQFHFWGSQSVSLNLLRIKQEDLIDKSGIPNLGYFPQKDPQLLNLIQNYSTLTHFSLKASI